MLRLDQLETEEAHFMVESPWRRQHVPTSRSTRAVVQQFVGVRFD